MVPSLQHRGPSRPGHDVNGESHPLNMRVIIFGFLAGPPYIAADTEMNTPRPGLVAYSAWPLAAALTAPIRL